MLCKAVPSFNWMQGSVTCVRKWDYDSLVNDSLNLRSVGKAVGSPDNI